MIILPHSSQCATCKHFSGVIQPDGSEQTERFSCEAFPDGIAAEVILNVIDHTKPIAGDHGIHWEAIDATTAQSK